jgi:hypothetical protein
MMKRFAICDETGSVLNVVEFSGDPPELPWPGYGSHWVFAGVGKRPVVERIDARMTYVEPVAKMPVGQGDRVQLATGEVYPRVPRAALLPSRDELRAYASNKRWEVETGGARFGLLSIPTDDRAKTMIGRAARTTSDVTSTPYIVNGVNYGVLTKAQFEAMDAAIDVHVAATFDTLASVLSDISAGTITTYAEIDAAAWPSNGGGA